MVMGLTDQGVFLDQTTKNFRLGVVHECLWGLAYGMVNPLTMLSMAASDLGASASGIGAFEALCFTGINAVQLASAFLFSPRWTEPRLTALMHWPAILATALGAALFLPGLKLDPDLRLLLFATTFVVHWVAIGFVVPFWGAMAERNIPSALHGRYFGMSFAISNLLGAGSGALAARWVAAGGLQWGYSLCFGLAMLLQTLSVVVLAYTRPLKPAPEAPGPLRPFLKEQAKQLREHPALQSYLVLLFLLQLGSASVALFTAHYKALGVPNADFDVFNASLALGSMVGCLGLGYLVDWKGGRVALAAALLPMLAALFILLLKLPPAWGTGAYFGGGTFSGVWGAVCFPLVLRYAPQGKTIAFLGLASTLGSLTNLMPLALGALADYAGYQATFALSVAGCLACLAFVALRPELDHRGERA